MKWKEYVKLFGTDPSHIELINKVASGFLDGGVSFGKILYCILHVLQITTREIFDTGITNLITDDKALKEKVECLIKTALKNQIFVEIGEIEVWLTKIWT